MKIWKAKQRAYPNQFVDPLAQEEHQIMNNIIIINHSNTKCNKKL